MILTQFHEKVVSMNTEKDINPKTLTRLEEFEKTMPKQAAAVKFSTNLAIIIRNTIISNQVLVIFGVDFINDTKKASETIGESLTNFIATPFEVITDVL